MLSGIHAAQAPRRRAQGLVVDCDVGLRGVTHEPEGNTFHLSPRSPATGRRRFVVDVQNVRDSSSFYAGRLRMVIWQAA